MSSATTRPAALRLTDADRGRLLAHGGTVRAAVLKLLSLADEHATCGPPRVSSTATTRGERAAPQPALQQASARSYVVLVGGEQVYSTTNRALAEKRERMERTRRPADPVTLVER